MNRDGLHTLKACHLIERKKLTSSYIIINYMIANCDKGNENKRVYDNVKSAGAWPLFPQHSPFEIYSFEG